MSCPNTTTHYNAKAVEMFWAVTTAISKIEQELDYAKNYRRVHFSLLCFSAWPVYAFKLCDLLGFFLQIDILQEQEDN